VIVHALEAQAFGTNCYVIAADAGAECVIVDPGVGVADRVSRLLKRQRLTPAAVLLTHGHLDHVYDLPLVVGAAPGRPAAHIHPEDRYRLRNPAGDLDPAFVTMIEAQLGSRAVWHEPEVVVELAPSCTTGARAPGVMATLSVAGLDISVTHAPGHTEGSVVFGFDEVPEGPVHPAGSQSEPPLQRTVLSGDVLFAGAIGRTDLPGGDPAAMTRSLRDVVLAWPDSTLVLPGHGPATTMARERTSNPFLRGRLV